jgi:lipopolysaccharide/colanic/teichoic acid biosynthesis glycosyltransferase
MRLFDMSAAILGGLLLLPLVLLVGMLVAVCDGRPVLFRQVRIGQYGRPFTLFKFRTMQLDPDKERGFEAGSARRVTRIGRMLRRTKLDEVPQLMNIVRGDMSVVGPRPEVPKWVEACPELFRKTLESRPGITDPASIVFRNEQHILATFSDAEHAYRELVLPAKLELSAQYLASRSFKSDLSVVTATMLAVAGLPNRWSHIDASALLQTTRH